MTALGRRAFMAAAAASIAAPTAGAKNAPLRAWTGLQCRLRTAISHITMSST